MDPHSAALAAARLQHALDRSFAEVIATEAATRAQMAAELERIHAAFRSERRAARTLAAIIRRDPTALDPRRLP